MCETFYLNVSKNFVAVVLTLLAFFSFVWLHISYLFRTSKVKNKGPKDIMAVEDMNGEVRFSTHLPYPNNLSRSRQMYSFSYQPRVAHSFCPSDQCLCVFIGHCWNQQSLFCRCCYCGTLWHVVEGWILTQTSHAATQLYRIFST